MNTMQQSSFSSCDATSSQTFSNLYPNPHRANIITSDALAKLHKKKAKYKAYEKDLFGKQQKRHKLDVEKESDVSPFPFSSHSVGPRSSFNSSYPQSFFSHSLPQMLLPPQPISLQSQTQNQSQSQIQNQSQSQTQTTLHTQTQNHSQTQAQKVNSESNRTIAPFITKLYSIVSSPETEHLIHWSEEHKNNAFVVTDAVEFATTLLPQFFKHSNFCSFVRQLNLYDFHKISSSSGYAFMHEHFRMNSPHLLTNISRKKNYKKQKKDPQFLNSPQNQTKILNIKRTPNQSPNHILTQTKTHSHYLTQTQAQSQNNNQNHIPNSNQLTSLSPHSDSSPTQTITIEKKVKDFLTDRQQDKSVTYQCLFEETEQLKHKNIETNDRIVQLKEMLTSSQTLECKLVKCIEIIATQLTQRGVDLSSVLNLLRQNETNETKQSIINSSFLSSEHIRPLNEPTVVGTHSVVDEVENDSHSFFEAMETEQRHLELAQSEHVEVVLTEEPIVLNWRFEG